MTDDKDFWKPYEDANELDTATSDIILKPIIQRVVNEEIRKEMKE